MPRREFLYDITFWEARRIIRGYSKRNILHYQLLRLCAYGSFFCMSGSDKTPLEWLPMYFDRDTKQGIEVSQEDIDELQELMRNINKK